MLFLWVPVCQWMVVWKRWRGNWNWDRIRRIVIIILIEIWLQGSRVRGVLLVELNRIICRRYVGLLNDIYILIESISIIWGIFTFIMVTNGSDGSRITSIHWHCRGVRIIVRDWWFYRWWLICGGFGTWWSWLKRSYLLWNWQLMILCWVLFF